MKDTISTKKMVAPHIDLAHAYWKQHLRPEDCAIDATCGNGWDTLALAQMQDLGLLIGIDIQEIALQNTGTLLQKSLPEPLLAKIQLHRLCHSKLDSLALPIAPRLIAYNLGYLPSGDKAITTQTNTTLESLHLAEELLQPQGALSITCYPGHPEGKREEAAILSWAEELDSTDWRVCYHRWVNRPLSPTLFWIVKIYPTWLKTWI